MCRPSCQEVYGIVPTAGQQVSQFSGAYPISLVTRMASGSVAAKFGASGCISRAARETTCERVGLDISEAPLHVLPNEPPYPPRLWHQDPDWIGELCDSLKFTECFRYKFVKSGHINVNETRTYKCWIKHLAKSEPNSRVVGILDSRVTIGATSKGRSSSFPISRVLQRSLKIRPCVSSQLCGENSSSMAAFPATSSRRY